MTAYVSRDVARKATYKFSLATNEISLNKKIEPNGSIFYYLIGGVNFRDFDIVKPSGNGLNLSPSCVQRVDLL